MILYILLSGVPPFWGESEQQIFDSILKGNLDFQSEPWPQISSEAKDCVKQMLQQVSSFFAKTFTKRHLPYLTQTALGTSVGHAGCNPCS